MRAYLLAFAVLLLATVAWSREPQIEQLSALAVNHQVSVHFTLAGAFTNAQTVQSLESGTPTGFTFVVEIFRDRPSWFDEGIARSRIEVIATFNSVTREYLLNYRRDGRLVRSETFGDLVALEKRMATVDEGALFEIGNRRPYKLKVRVRADFMRGWLLYIIPWDVSTRWKETRVKMPEGAR